VVLKNAAEVIAFGEAGVVGDFLDGVFGVSQQMAGSVDAPGTFCEQHSFNHEGVPKVASSAKVQYRPR
jgi:hypothetical protein